MKFKIQNLKFKIYPPLCLTFFLLFGLAFTTATPVFAQGLDPGQAADFNSLWPAALTLWLPLGLLLLMSSATPEEQAPAMAVNLLLAWSVATLAYFGVGFAFHFGGIAQVSPNPDLRGLYWEWYPLDQSVDLQVARLWGVIALQGWALSGEAATPGAFLLFLSHLSLAGAAAMIPVSVLPQRTKGGTASLIGLLVGALIYPLGGNWLWGGGWLANLGSNLGLGHGLIDFGGASVVFLAGSLVALAALLLRKSAPNVTPQLQPAAEVVVMTRVDNRLTVYEEASAPVEEILSVTPMPSAYLPILGLLGASLTLFSWFGLATGLHLPTALNFSPAQATINGLLAALGAALMAAGYSWFTTRGVNPLMIARGLVAGLIVASAGAPFTPAWAALAAGLLMGLLLPLLIYLFNQGLHLADDMGTLATYGMSALISLLLVSLFADGRAGQGWNGLGLTNYQGVAGQGVSGLLVTPGFASDWPGQFQAQLLGLGAISLWAFMVGFLLFQTINVVAQAWARTGLELTDPILTPSPRQSILPEEEHNLPPDSPGEDAAII